MRTMKLVTWSAKNPDGSEVKENILEVFGFLLTNPTSAEQMPRGFELFKIFKRIDYAFTKASETQVLSLEEAEYQVIRSIVLNGIPASWAFKKEVVAQVEIFMNLPEDDVQ